MNYVEKALENRKKGYNCSQAVACAFCEEAGVDEKIMFSMMEGFGGGMGSRNGVCGAVSGAVAAVGMRSSSGNLEKPDSKAATCRLTGEILERFTEKNQTAICRELKGAKTGEVLRTCEGCIEDAVLLAEEMMERLEAQEQG